MSFSDFSGQASVSLSWNIFSSCSLNFGPFILFGKQNSEFGRLVDLSGEASSFNDKILTRAGISLSVSLGGGRF